MTAMTITAQAFVASRRPGAVNPLLADRSSTNSHADPRNMAQAAAKLAEMGFHTMARSYHGFTFFGDPHNFETAFGSQPQWIAPEFDADGIETEPGQWFLPDSRHIDLTGQLDDLFWGVEILAPSRYPSFHKGQPEIETTAQDQALPHRIYPEQLRDTLTPSGTAKRGLNHGQDTHIVVADTGLDKTHSHWNHVGLGEIIKSVSIVHDKNVIARWQVYEEAFEGMEYGFAQADQDLTSAIAAYDACGPDDIAAKKQIVEGMVGKLRHFPDSDALENLEYIGLPAPVLETFKARRIELEKISTLQAKTLVASGPLAVAKTLLGLLREMLTKSKAVHSHSKRSTYQESPAIYHGTQVMSQVLSVAPAARYTVFQVINSGFFAESSYENLFMRGFVAIDPFDNPDLKALKPDIFNYSNGDAVFIASQKETANPQAMSIADHRLSVEARAREIKNEINRMIEWPCLVVQAVGNSDSALQLKSPPPGMEEKPVVSQETMYPTMIDQPGYLSVGSASIERREPTQILRPSSEAHGGVFTFTNGEKVASPNICGYGTAQRIKTFKADDVALMVPWRKRSGMGWSEGMLPVMGTSFTAPQVAGAAAVYLSAIRKEISGDKIKPNDLADILRHFSQELTPDPNTEGLDDFLRLAGATSVFDTATSPKPPPGMVSLGIFRSKLIIQAIARAFLNGVPET